MGKMGFEPTYVSFKGEGAKGLGITSCKLRERFALDGRSYQGELAVGTRARSTRDLDLQEESRFAG
jgi:hypothetical protein